MKLDDNVFLSPQAKLETKALKAKRPGFTDERYHETSYYIENGKFIKIKTKTRQTDEKLSSSLKMLAVS